MRSLLLALPLGLVACDTAPVAGPSLDETAWVLDSFEGREAPPSSLAFQAGRFSGVAVCNQYAGAYSASYTDVAGLVFSADVEDVTEVACADGLNAYEEAYWDALEAATRWALDEIDDRLTLTGPGVRLVFEPAPAFAPVDGAP